MDVKCLPAAGLMDPLAMPQSACVEPWYRGGGDDLGRWHTNGRHPLMERYCSAAAAAAAMAAKYGRYDTAMFNDRAAGAVNSVTVDCIQQYRSTSGYVSYRQPFMDVSGRYTCRDKDVIRSAVAI